MPEPRRGARRGDGKEGAPEVVEEKMGEILERWFRDHRRDLPWRRHYDPYSVWISEMMLQQTQMERGVAYYLRWMERFPDVASVASATEDEVLKAWEGLGYYSRARHIHRAARLVMTQCGGQIPGDAVALRALPGIGPYTVGALLSIAFNLPVPAVDANAERVLARLLDEPEPVKSSAVRRRFETVIREMMRHGAPREITQGLMEFGALLCTPRNPSCASCPGADLCAARRHGTVAERPRLPEKTPLRRMGRIAGVLLSPEGRIFLRRRPSEGLWGGLWEFPGEDVRCPALSAGAPWPEDFLQALPASAPEDFLARAFGGAVRVERTPFLRVRYSYTVHRVEMAVFRCSPLEDMRELSGACRWVAPEDLASYALASGNRAVARALGGKKGGGGRGKTPPPPSSF